MARDSDTLTALPNIVRYLLEIAPAGAHGSEENVVAWVKRA